MVLLTFKVRSTSTPSYLRLLIMDQEHGRNLRSTTTALRQPFTLIQYIFCISRADPGGPYFWQSILFFTLYRMSEKIFLELNLDFIVADIRGVFGSVGVYACVCESKSWPLLFLFYKGPILNDIYPRPF